MDMSIDHVLNIDVPIADRKGQGRRVCKACGATYHVMYNSPSREGLCDSCGGALIQREDDREETVKE